MKTVYSALAIESSSLVLGEMIAVIKSKVAAGKQAEVKELKNDYEACYMTHSGHCRLKVKRENAKRGRN